MSYVGNPIKQASSVAAENIVGDIQASQLASGAVEGAITTPFSFRNKIIGGDFTTNPWQRGTSFTAPASGAYTADRFSISVSSDAVVNVLKTADAPTAAQAGVYTQHCLHVDVTTADASIAAAQYLMIAQFLEGLNAASFGFGQSGTRNITLSFWHKHTKTGTYCVGFTNSAINRSYVAEYTQDVTDTWEKATITIPVDTTGTWLYDSGVGLRVYFVAASGSEYQTTANTWAAGAFWATANQVNALDSTANNFKLALIQLEAGSVATPFETRPYGVELALCQRYYYRNNPETSDIFGLIYCNTTTSAVVVTPFHVEMRQAPTSVEQSGNAADYGVYYSNGIIACSNVPTFNAISSKYVGSTNFPVSSGLTANTTGCGYKKTSSGYLGWSAEL